VQLLGENQEDLDLGRVHARSPNSPVDDSHCRRVAYAMPAATCRAPSAAPMIRIASVARARRSLGMGLLLCDTV
jgi:hypothetical protein